MVFSDKNIKYNLRVWDIFYKEICGRYIHKILQFLEQIPCNDIKASHLSCILLEIYDVGEGTFIWKDIYIFTLKNLIFVNIKSEQNSVLAC